MLTLALQTDSRGVSAVLTERAKAGGARLHGVAVVGRDPSAKKLADALRDALPKLRGGKPEVAVALGPDEVRVRRLSVPPAPAAELPPLVAMQAAREAGVDADAIVTDFLPPDGPADGPQTLLAAWASDECLAYWREVADELGGKLSVVTARPLATVTLAAGAAPSLVASRAGDAVDFVATSAGQPVLLRSAHVGAGDAGRELRRTLLALSGEGVEAPRVLVAQSDIADDAAVVDWTTLMAPLGADATQAAALAESAAATGLAIAPGAPALNLADPRKPPVAETGRRRQILLAAAAATVLLAGAWMAYDRMAQLDRQIQEKEREIAAAEEEVEAFEPYRDRVAALDAWRSSDVTWLDELDRIAQQLRPEPLDAEDFPVDSDIRATQVIATAFLGGDEPGGRVDLQAVARSSSTRELESRLRDAEHPVEPISTTETPAKDAYKYKYSVLLRVPADRGEDDADEPDDEPDAEGSP